MKAISIKQPFANFILFGWKSIETRTWETAHRGPMVIVASKEIQQGVCILNGRHYDCLDVIRLFWQNEIPLNLGKTICEVQLTHVNMMTLEHQSASCCPIYDGAKAWCFGPPFKEDIMERLDWVTPLVPVEIRGQMGVYDIPDEMVIRDKRPFLRDVFTPEFSI